MEGLKLSSSVGCLGGGGGGLDVSSLHMEVDYNIIYIEI